MDFSCLPALVIEEVAEYLDLNDIIACSGVCSQWRTAFDSDVIWKRFSTFNKDYLKKQRANQINTSNYLFGGCKSKKDVFRELQVGRNLVEGKYDLVKIDIGRWYCDNFLDLVDDDGNHWLFISCAENYTFESAHTILVWNMNDKPILHQALESPLGETKRLLDSQMRAYKNKLYYWESNILIAFEFSRPEYNLTVIFQIFCPHVQGIRNYNAMVCKPNMVLGFVFTDMHSQLSKVPWVRVWGEDSSLLYKSYSVDEEHDMEHHIHERLGSLNRPASLIVKDGGSSDNVLLAYEFCFGDLQTLSVLLFNIKTFKYTSLFVIKSEGLLFCERPIKLKYCELDNQTVVVYYKLNSQLGLGSRADWVSKLLCCSTDEKILYEPDLRSKGFNLSISTADGGKKVLVFDNASEKVSVFDVFQSKEISAFRIPLCGNMGTLVRNNLRIIQEEKGSNTLALYDFKQGKRLYGFEKLQESRDYMFTFSKAYRSPSKIFGTKHSNDQYARYCNGEIVMISFL